MYIGWVLRSMQQIPDFRHLSGIFCCIFPAFWKTKCFQIKKKSRQMTKICILPRGGGACNWHPGMCSTIMWDRTVYNLFCAEKSIVGMLHIIFMLWCQIIFVMTFVFSPIPAFKATIWGEQLNKFQHCQLTEVMTVMYDFWLEKCDRWTERQKVMYMSRPVTMTYTVTKESQGKW